MTTSSSAIYGQVLKVNPEIELERMEKLRSVQLLEEEIDEVLEVGEFSVEHIDDEWITIGLELAHRADTLQDRAIVNELTLRYAGDGVQLLSLGEGLLYAKIRRPDLRYPYSLMPEEEVGDQSAD